ncbi:hypothetical protein LP419_20175 [Massilia sp. H-1]|nr:hypothetical protein LP419_20175 [Massilia sp. H-1]
MLTGLPSNFDVQTMRVAASPGLRVGAVTTLDAAIGSEARNPVEANLVEKIQALQDQKALLDAEASAAQAVKNYLEKLDGNSGSDKPGPGPDGKALAGMIDTLGKGVSASLVKMQKIAVQQRALNASIDVLQRDLARLEVGLA